MLTSMQELNAKQVSDLQEFLRFLISPRTKRKGKEFWCDVITIKKTVLVKILLFFPDN